MLEPKLAPQEEYAPELPVAPAIAHNALLANLEFGDPAQPMRALAPLAVITSCVLHAAAAATMLITSVAPSQYGLLDTKSDAISLEATQSIVLESTISEPLDSAAAAAAAMPEGSVAQVEAEPLPIKEAEELPIEKPTEAQPIKEALLDPEAIPADEEPLEVLRGAADLVAAPVKKAEEKKPDQKLQAENDKKKRNRREEAKRQRPKQHTAGGTTSRANAAMGKSSGRASASRGSVLSYAARVRAKVAHNKPAGRGHRGIARVAFAVSGSGGLSYARLAQSSGNAALDLAALSAVRSAAPFGAPPTGATAAQLRFSIPFYFR
jgi:protein TonB